MKLDLEELRRMTLEAIAQGEKEPTIKFNLSQYCEEKDDYLLRKRVNASRKKAEEILEQIPLRAQIEAQVGRRHAVLMSLNSSYYDHWREASRFNICQPEWLYDAARLVYEGCVSLGLKPTIEYWHDDEGINSGFNIVIHWLQPHRRRARSTDRSAEAF